MLESRKAAAPIVRLWLLRMLVPLGAHKKFIADFADFYFDEIVQGLGLEHWWVKQGKNYVFNRKSALKELTKLHRIAEKELKNAKAPDSLANNIKQVAKLVKLSETDYRVFEFLTLLHTERSLAVEKLAKLSETDCRILEFLTLLHTERSLAEAVNIAPLDDLRDHQDVVSVLSALLALPRDEIYLSLAKNSGLIELGLVKLDLNPHGRSLEYILELPDEFADRFVSADSDSVDLLQGMFLRDMFS